MKTAHLATRLQAVLMGIVLGCWAGQTANAAFVTLQNSGVSTNRTKFGYTGYLDNTKYYRTQTLDYHDYYDAREYVTCANMTSGYNERKSQHLQSSTVTYPLASGGAYSTVASSETLFFSNVDYCTNSINGCTTTWGLTISPDWSCYSLFWGYRFSLYLDVITNTTQQDRFTATAGTNYTDSGTDYEGHYTSDTTLSDLFASSDLASITDPGSAYGGWSGASGGNNTAPSEFYMTPDETFCFRSRIKWRVAIVGSPGEEVPIKGTRYNVSWIFAFGIPVSPIVSMAPIEETITVSPDPGFIWIGGVWVWGGGGWRWERGGGRCCD